MIHPLCANFAHDVSSKLCSAASAQQFRQKSVWLWSSSKLVSLVVLAFGLALVPTIFVWSARGSQPATEIFAGVVYGREQLSPTEEGSGLLHWARIDLTAPGIELYVTPLDPGAVAQGWQYRLSWLRSVMNREHLAVAINGTMFTSNSIGRFRLPGDLAKGVETVVADGVVSHVWEHTYLLWFDADLTPHLTPRKQPLASELAQAKWAIGGQAVWLHGRTDLARKRS